MSSEPQTDQPLDSIKGSIEKFSNSNAYCWVVLSACLVGLALAFVFHEDTQYSDKFFLLLAILTIGVIININQLRKNYLKRKESMRK